ncbi:hypothetical protein [Ochrobactrum sp. MYb379]|uniref:hypothetical protein n=1 Tax=Ochrobactrum sp. MYb379 TaxID=2745275 RepID=UPI0030AD7F29
MNEKITQADIGRSLKVTSMTVSRVMRSLNSEATTTNETDVLKTLIVGELQKCGFTLSVCLELMTEVSQDLQYVLHDASNQCWVIFVEREGQRSYRLTALNPAQLVAIVDGLGMVLVLPLHRIVEDARIALSRIEPTGTRPRKGAAA